MRNTAFNIFFCVFLGIGISACTTDNVATNLKPQAELTQNTDPVAQPDNTTALAQQPNQTLQNPANQQIQTASLQPTPGINFLPVLGPPKGAIAGLSAAIKRNANRQAITIAQGGAAKYQVKGYFSALDDGAATRFIFIWDILDAGGNNVHRISGEERIARRSSDPWNAIDNTTLDRVVGTSMQNLRQWIGQRT